MSRKCTNVLVAAVICLACVLAIVRMWKQPQLQDSINRARLNRMAAKVQDTLNNTRIYPGESRGAIIFQDQTGTVRIPATSALDLLDLHDLEELYHRYLESIQTLCHDQIRLGKLVDGGYHVCLDPDVRPSSTCLAYSFGIRRDFDFEDQLSELCGCEVHCFDPDDGQSEHQHAEKVFFHPVGIAGNDQTVNNDGGKPWVLKTVSTIKKDLGHTDRQLEVLKIDPEGAEWEALAQMLRMGTLGGVKQLIMELHHYVRISKFALDHRNKAQYIHHLEIFRELYDVGFRIFFFRSFSGSYCTYRGTNNEYRTGCHEVHFMRV